MIRTRTGLGAPAEKGWVREGILSGLSKSPMTLTQVSEELGVSKSTASYHLSELLGRGVIEIVDTRPGRGRVVVKRYGLKEGSLVLFSSSSQEEAELGRLRETFELQALGWRAPESRIDLMSLQILLYRLFLHMFRITRSEHRGLMEDYGQKTGGIMASLIRTGPFRQTLVNVASYLRSSRISQADVIEVPGSPISVVASGVCIGSTLHGGNPCYFLEGILRGIVTAKLGAGVHVARIEMPDLNGCYLAVGRAKSIDAHWVAEALLSSPLRSELGRGRGGEY